jgi:hypothetical protein
VLHNIDQITKFSMKFNTMHIVWLVFAFGYITTLCRQDLTGTLQYGEPCSVIFDQDSDAKEICKGACKGGFDLVQY